MKKLLSLVFAGTLSLVLAGWALSQVPAALVRSRFVIGNSSAQSSSGWPFTPPVLGSFTFVNQESATASTNFSGIDMFFPAGNDLNLLMTALPSAPYTITAEFVPTLFPVNFIQLGIMLGDGGGKVKTFSVAFNGGLSGLNLLSQDYNSPTSFSGTDFNFVGPSSYAAGPSNWFRIQDDGTNRIYSVSQSGSSFVVLISQSDTTFLTATLAGFGGTTISSATSAGMRINSWTVTTP